MFQGVISKVKTSAIQFRGVVSDVASSAIEFLAVLSHSYSSAIQFRGVLSHISSMGAQYLMVSLKQLGAQFKSVLYNTVNLRVLMQFPSRGLTGTNWTANSTMAGDFSVLNVNTDIVEECWRSASGVKTGLQLVCDSEVSQGIFIDTFALLNHNLTTGAEVFLIGSNDSGFSTVIFSKRITITNINAYWISPDTPQERCRYWKITIEDTTNQENYLQIGTIVFGESIVMHGECYSNPIKYRKQHFVDTVQTEGFTNVANDRGVKKSIGLSFQNINFSGSNYDNITNIFDTAKTNLKCLWIPTPSYPGRYAVFGKLTQLPEESHLSNGENADYVDFDVEVDEAK
jgi:hypothetical protein